jgi:hypothetical protein
MAGRYALRAPSAAVGFARAFALAPLRRTLDRAARPLSVSAAADAASPPTAPTAPTAADADAGAPFAELQGMHPAVTKALATLGFAGGTGIQSRAIPAVARGSDVVIAAETGSGRGLHSFTFSSTSLSLCPMGPSLTHECVPNVLKLSCDVNECKPLSSGKTLAYLAPVFSNLLANASAAGAYTRPLFSST